MKAWSRIILHHSASEWGNAKVIDGWHREIGYNGIGYNFVILNGCLNAEDAKMNFKFDSLVGSIECGRPIDGDQWVEANEVGAHALGFNADSIGICLIHLEKAYDKRMTNSALALVRNLMTIYSIPADKVIGHYEVDKGKPLCPGIDMKWFRERIKEMNDEQFHAFKFPNSGPDLEAEE